MMNDCPNDESNGYGSHNTTHPLPCLVAAVQGQAVESEFSGPKKWTAEEIADGYRGIRWITKHGVHGRPTETDLRRWLQQNPMCKDPAAAVMTAGD